MLPSIITQKQKTNIPGTHPLRYSNASFSWADTMASNLPRSYGNTSVLLINSKHVIPLEYNLH